MSDQLTPRQAETLKAIQKLTNARGVPPTLKGLCGELDVSSDQAVLELIARLERKGYLTRDPGSARGIFLTDKARLLLSGSLSLGSAVLDPSAPPAVWELTPRQLTLLQRLTDIDEGLGRMYSGAIRVLRDPLNEDAISQSAHSIRQVIDHLSRKADLPKDVSDRIKENRNTGGVRIGLRYFFDPRGGEGLAETVYDLLYNKFQVEFNYIAHHEKTVSKEYFETKLIELEIFLISYILPSQLETYEAIDQILQNGPKDASAPDLFALITKSVESYRYFFRKVDHQWLDFLDSNQFLRPTWGVCDYLVRTAEPRPDQTAQVLLRLEIPSDDWRSRDACILAASKLPGKLAASFSEKLLQENFPEQATGRLLAHRLRDLLDTLIRAEEFKAALRLADRLLEVASPVLSEPAHHRRVRTALDDYEYSIITKSLYAIPPEHVAPFIRLLVAKLGSLVSFEHATGEGNEDLSSGWRPAIEEHPENWGLGDVEESLVNAIRDLLEKRIRHLLEKTPGSKLEAAVDGLLEHDLPYTIFDRIKIHLFRVFKDAFLERIGHIMRDEISDPYAWHEYARLVEETFPILPKDVQATYFELIDRGPGGRRREFLEKWRVRRLALVKAFLTPEQRKKYAKLLKKTTALEKPDFLITHYVGSVGPESPTTESDLASLSSIELVDRLKAWTPKEQFLGPSRSGFASTFCSIVTKDAAKFSREAQRFGDEGIRPVYVYHLLLGLEQGMKAGAGLNWRGILELGAGIIDRWKKGLLPEFERSGVQAIWETNWDGVLLQLARLIAHGLDLRERGIAHKFSARVWKLIENLCEHPDPTPEHEAKYGGDNTAPFNLSLNTVRGQAFHTLFSYVFWKNWVQKAEKGGQAPLVPDVVKRVLERHLIPAHDPSLTVRSVIGHRLPWILAFGGEWADHLVPLLFPDDASLRYAVWETYLSNQVFADAYKRLRPQYEQALRDLELNQVPKRRYWADPVEHLAHHVMIAYAHDLDVNPNPFHDEFFRRAKGKYRGLAVSFGGRAYVSCDTFPRGDRPPERSTLQRFWEWRLASSNSPNELKEFGWWAKKDRFDNQWMLERLLETLKGTKGEVEGHMIVLAALKDLARSYPLPSVEILDLMVKCRSQKSYFLSAYSGEMKHILGEILRSEDAAGKKIALRLVDHMTKLGFEDFRDLVRESA